MNEENENQPAPLETEPASTEQRHHRPRRRYPRRRYRDRGDRFGGDNSGESPNSSAVVDTNSVGAGVETLDRSAPGGREGAEGAVENGEQVQAEPEFGEGIIEVSGKGFGFLRDSKRNLCRHRRTFLSRRNRSPFCFARWHVDSRRNTARQPRSPASQAIDNYGDEPPKYQGLRPFEKSPRLTRTSGSSSRRTRTVHNPHHGFDDAARDGPARFDCRPAAPGKTTLLHHIAEAVTKTTRTCT